MTRSKCTQAWICIFPTSKTTLSATTTDTKPNLCPRVQVSRSQRFECVGALNIGFRGSWLRVLGLESGFKVLVLGLRVEG